MNRVILIGHLTAEPDIRDLPDGRRIAILSLTTSDKWIDEKSGEPCEHIERSRVSASCESFVEFAEMHLHKGAKIRIEGSLETRQWVDKQNIERYSTDIVLRPSSGDIRLLSPSELPPEISPPVRVVKRQNRSHPNLEND
jgi:single-strand DNA-binding protein